MRPDVIAAAIKITAHRRYVPWAICLTCMRHVYPEVHKREVPDHLTMTLSREEQDEVAHIHKAALDAQFASYEQFRRI